MALVMIGVQSRNPTLFQNQSLATHIRFTAPLTHSHLTPPTLTITASSVEKLPPLPEISVRDALSCQGNELLDCPLLKRRAKYYNRTWGEYFVQALRWVFIFWTCLEENILSRREMAPLLIEPLTSPLHYRKICSTYHKFVVMPQNGLCLEYCYSKPSLQQHQPTE